MTALRRPGAPPAPWDPDFLAGPPQGPWTEHLHQGVQAVLPVQRPVQGPPTGPVQAVPQVPLVPRWLAPGAGAVAVGAGGVLYSVEAGAPLHGPTPEALRVALTQRMQVRGALGGFAGVQVERSRRLLQFLVALDL